MTINYDLFYKSIMSKREQQYIELLKCINDKKGTNYQTIDEYDKDIEEQEKLLGINFNECSELNNVVFEYQLKKDNLNFTLVTLPSHVYDGGTLTQKPKIVFQYKTFLMINDGNKIINNLLIKYHLEKHQSQLYFENVRNLLNSNNLTFLLKYILEKEHCISSLF